MYDLQKLKEELTQIQSNISTLESGIEQMLLTQSKTRVTLVDARNNGGDNVDALIKKLDGIDSNINAFQKEISNLIMYKVKIDGIIKSIEAQTR